jgi:hypothetical protein
MMPALHEKGGTAEGECLLDLLEDHRLRQEIALAPVARAPVERAEVAVGVANVRVVQVSVDDERDAPAVDLAVAKLVGSASDGYEVAAFEQRERVLVRNALAVERLVQNLGGAHAETASVARKRSSGTRSSSPASWASSKKLKRPARSRGPKR